MRSVALAATGMLSAVDALAQDQTPYPTRNDRSTSAPGPGNLSLDAQNPDSFLPPPSDAGGVQTFKYPFALSHKRLVAEDAEFYHDKNGLMVGGPQIVEAIKNNLCGKVKRELVPGTL